MRFLVALKITCTGKAEVPGHAYYSHVYIYVCTCIHISYMHLEFPSCSKRMLTQTFGTCALHQPEFPRMWCLFVRGEPAYSFVLWERWCGLLRWLLVIGWVLVGKVRCDLNLRCDLNFVRMISCHAHAYTYIHTYRKYMCILCVCMLFTQIHACVWVPMHTHRPNIQYHTDHPSIQAKYTVSYRSSLHTGYARRSYIHHANTCMCLRSYIHHANTCMHIHACT